MENGSDELQQWCTTNRGQICVIPCDRRIEHVTSDTIVQAIAEQQKLVQDIEHGTLKSDGVNKHVAKRHLMTVNSVCKYFNGRERVNGGGNPMLHVLVHSSDGGVVRARR